MKRFAFYQTFFFSSRRRHTRWPRDWSSDVCSSDLRPGLFGFAEECPTRLHPLPGASPAEYHLELRRKPGTGGKDLTGGHRDLRLVVGDVTQVFPDRLAPLQRIRERGLDEDGVGSEGRENGVDLRLRPAPGEAV